MGGVGKTKIGTDQEHCPISCHKHQQLWWVQDLNNTKGYGILGMKTQISHAAPWKIKGGLTPDKNLVVKLGQEFGNFKLYSQR